MGTDESQHWLPRIPQTRSGKELERKALRIRKFAGAGDDRPINPFQLARQLNVRVVNLDDLEGISNEAREQLLNLDSNGWSGGATTALADGSRIENRDYDAEREREAYGVGAAVLLPYVALKRRLERGIEASAIAREFGISVALVKYRAKITGLWKLLLISK